MNQLAPSIVWFRQDLRVKDNPALREALETGMPIIPIYIWNPREKPREKIGKASRWWLHHSLTRLDKKISTYGSRLILRSGNPRVTLQKLVRATGAKVIYWNRSYEQETIRLLSQIQKCLEAENIQVKTYNSQILFEPSCFLNKKHTPYKIFTPFWKECQNRTLRFTSNTVLAKWPTPSLWPVTEDLKDWKLLSSEVYDSALQSAWNPGEQGAHKLLKIFLNGNLASYEFGRNHPSSSVTSRLSPHLHFGEISPSYIWNCMRRKTNAFSNKNSDQGALSFLRQIAWREFAYHLLFHFPHLKSQPMKHDFLHFPWEKNPLGLQAWQQGKTGYPLVDAGMRELISNGWIHNRIRLVVASFLVKDLLLPWQVGANWFGENLVDADQANNTLGWQWITGCGPDPSPYFRIFNPVAQSMRFDPEGYYIRRWIPELRKIPTRWLHQPWKAPNPILQKSGVELGLNYPYPIIDHARCRQKALDAFRTMKLQRLA